MMSILYQRCYENIAKTFHAIIQEMFLKGVLTNYCKYSYMILRMFFEWFHRIKTSFWEIFPTPFYNISRKFIHIFL